ncbi:unnamed protein product (macronuclear) [Paramecium tetraurelia]|uniref:Proteasome subunit alpha type n=1 Tax=Paramecium tetraurelia TaxID=5888 RepID=A0BCV7_PARTE|nr:uncharacterized protein GSPATT00004468001 [Paramecium tetraurelia]CAK56374.1 unnamed protein product [Paramecium tetraurelia]|eukprot:XP_001423772.1 hypothetical protein (macronuclear) [Paramecium tetraurelia strain d4-2]
MLKHLYDTDCVTWSPQGKLFQVEYAMEAVKQGSICLGLKSNENVVLCSLKRQPSELAGYQEKQFKIDDHMAIAIAGLTADARVLCKYMRTECLEYKYTYESHHPVGRLVFKVAEKSQHKTQSGAKRPYGVGLLVAGIDPNGVHLFETCPSGNYYEYKCQAIGSRSQAARTYFESWFHLFEKSTLEQLILHGLSALKKAIMEDEELNERNVEVGILGKNQKFVHLNAQELKDYIAKLETFNANTQIQQE